MDTLVHIVGTLWIYLRRKHYLRLAMRAESELAVMAEIASGKRLLRIEKKREEIAGDILRLQAPFTWASMRRSNATVDHATGRVATGMMNENTIHASNESLVEVA